MKNTKKKTLLADTQKAYTAIRRFLDHPADELVAARLSHKGADMLRSDCIAALAGLEVLLLLGKGRR